jgi:BASS family bile acid:Na+ symporter
MPLLSFFVVKLFRLPPELAVGLILAGCAPGAMSSNVLCYVAKADVAYSVSLTTVSTLLCPILTPSLTFILANSMMEIDFLKMFINLVCVVILPVFLGYFMRHKFNEQIQKIEPIFPVISTTFIIFICSLVIAINKQYLAMVTMSVFLAVIVLNLVGMFFGFNIGRVFNFTKKMKRTLTIEIGMQNAGLGTVLALKYFGEKSAIPAAIFVFVCIITASFLAGVWQEKEMCDQEKRLVQ